MVYTSNVTNVPSVQHGQEVVQPLTKPLGENDRFLPEINYLPKPQWQVPSVYNPRVIIIAKSAEEKEEVPPRDQIPEEYKWRLEDLYPTLEAWVAEKKRIELEIKELNKLKGTLGKSADDLYTGLEKISELEKAASRLIVYAFAKADEEIPKYQELKDAAEQINKDFSAAASFVTPEILLIPEEVLKGFLSNEKLPVYKYKQFIDDIVRLRDHILSPEEEALLGKFGIPTATGQITASENIYKIFKDSDMPWPTVKLSDGSQVELSQSMYMKYRQSSNREDRRKVFDAFWGCFHEFENTYAKMLDERIRINKLYREARKHTSPLDAALAEPNIPVSVYHATVEGINKALPSLHRYMELRRKLLGVCRLRYYDMYAPLVKDVELKYPYEQGRNLVIEVLKPLGEDYANAIKRAFAERWIDVYPNKGKNSGAYMNGSAYDVHPYILLNYLDDLDSISTLAHELGHAMHSYSTNATQPYVYSDYTTFVAEVASTFNEMLLINHLIQNASDKNTKLFLLVEQLENIRTTVFRQALFAEFELAINEKIENGESLTADALNKLYTDLSRRYYGHDKGITEFEDIYSVEWAYIPHFYYNFYVYQYVTGFAAAVALTQEVAKRGQGALDKYLSFLKSGSSKYPIDLLKDAGVDLTTTKPIDDTIELMNATMDEIEKLITPAPPP